MAFLQAVRETRGADQNRTGVCVRSTDLGAFHSRVLAGDELGWRLAGLVDGEGCFHISRDPRKGNYKCGFTVGMRADDAAFLDLMQRSTGLGSIYQITPTVKTLSRRPGTNPQTHWLVARKADVLALAAMLDRYPPLSKKAGDFAIWREAVEAWRIVDKQTMARLFDEIREGRRYVDARVTRGSL